ncbi:MAG: hypothetical protein H0V82_11345 [Candidatus Protochlamydia sp.]|nr:hypothetical protein [Candidatus Protochlamydia sp.]
MNNINFNYMQFNGPPGAAPGFNFGLLYQPIHQPIQQTHVGMLICQSASVALSVTGTVYDVCVLKIKEIFEEALLNDGDKEV